jgi:2-polyprenyl-6-methoxyphenol hydroxylase-like FAD-dependent oxidoreductase
MKVVINGSGIAGPTLAWWLRRHGHDVVLVERAPELRSGGYIIDFWGAGYTVAERMGLLAQVKERGYPVREVRLLDAHGRRSGGFDTTVFARAAGGRFTSIGRSDLAAIIYAHLDAGVERRFGDSIAAIEPQGRRVRVTFEAGGDCMADLVVGADGLHSRVRSLAFGPEAKFEHRLGFHVAAFEVQGYRPRDELVYMTYGVPGRQVSRFSMRGDRTLALFVFRDEYLARAGTAADEDVRATLSSVFADAGWECPQLLEAMQDAGEIYFDRVSQIRMPGWSAGRVTLAGDAAACVSLLGGEGTGLAMVEAYVLAGELNAAGSDVEAALARYQQRLMPLLQGKQAAAARFASVFAPATRFGLRVRDLGSALLSLPLVGPALVRAQLRDDIELPEFG